MCAVANRKQAGVKISHRLAVLTEWTGDYQ
jgi:hypothetical protein